MFSDICNWHGFSASIPGRGHIRRGIPCQDASLAVTTPRGAVLVCDGRGSAKLSHFGAARAVDAFRRQIAILEPVIAAILDCEETKDDAWTRFCRIMYRTLFQVQSDLAAEFAQPEKEFDFTVAFAIAGKCHIGCFQVGDGAIVLRQNGQCVTAFVPEKGRFANQTYFLRANGETAEKFQHALFPASENSGLAATSDGPEHLMFTLHNMAPGKIFDRLFDDLADGSFGRQDLLDYLTRKDWDDDPRGADDRSLALLIPISAAMKNEPETRAAKERSVNDEKNPMTISSQTSQPFFLAEHPKTIPWLLQLAIALTLFTFAGILFEIRHLLAENRELHATIAEIKQMPQCNAVHQSAKMTTEKTSLPVSSGTPSPETENTEIAIPEKDEKKPIGPEKSQNAHL